ncbi:hypothetical protein ACLOJK_031159 [Asimina triloba]
MSSRTISSLQFPIFPWFVGYGTTVSRPNNLALVSMVLALDPLVWIGPPWLVSWEALFITPIPYWTNSFDAKRFPIFSSDLFYADGNSYNVSRVVDAKMFVFNQDGYDDYSKIYVTPFYAYAQGFVFAGVTASLTHAALFYGSVVPQVVRSIVCFGFTLLACKGTYDVNLGTTKGGLFKAKTNK